MDLLAYRNGVVSGLKQLVPEKTTVEGYAGRFDLAQLKTYSAKAPWVGVAVMGYTDGEDTELDVDVDAVLFILTKRTKQHNADEALLLWADAVPKQMKANLLFAGDNVGAARSIAFRNLFSTGVGDEGCALGQITFKQKASLSAVDAAGLGSFQKLYTDFTAPGAPDGTAPSMQDQSTFAGG